MNTVCGVDCRTYSKINLFFEASWKMVRKTARLEAICVFYLKGKVYEFDGNEPTTGN